MPYAAEHIPTYKRNRRPKRRPTQRGKCTIKESDLRRQVRWNLEKLEKEYVTVETVDAAHLIAVLRLDRIVTGYDRECGGRNALLKLRKDAGLEWRKEHGKTLYDVTDTVAKLHEWMKA